MTASPLPLPLVSRRLPDDEPTSLPAGTAGDLLDRFAADDALCHDPSLRPLLERLVSALDAEEGAAAGLLVTPTATIVLVRALAAHARRRPVLRHRALADIVTVQR